MCRVVHVGYRLYRLYKCRVMYIIYPMYINGMWFMYCLPLVYKCRVVVMYIVYIIYIHVYI